MSRSDEQVDRLLAALHRRDDGRASPDCLDGETLAAWMDDQLGGAALSRAETHAATCGHCQAMLAAMVRTAGAEARAAAPARSWFRRVLPWAAPLTAAATAAALYVAVRPPAQHEPQAPRAVQFEPAAEPHAAAAGQAAGPADDQLGRDAGARSAEAGVTYRSRPDAAAGAGSPPSSAASERRETLAPREDAKALADAAPSVPLPAAPRMPEPRPVPPDPDSLTRGLANRTGQPAQKPEAVRGGFAPPAAAQARAAEEAVLLAEPLVVATPDPAIRWRIAAGSAVERSTDGGVTWAAQHTDAGAGLTAGAAPSTDVCWIAGRGGTVHRTIDGGRIWHRVEFPESADLTRIVATSADAATVTASDGRTFTTTDGGRTWTDRRP